jgi:O-antigen/teichoic acid export membrane protein
MSDEAASYRRILKSSFIVGGASVVTILTGLIRTKVLAVLLGPSGVGLFSLYTGIVSAATAVSSMGLGTVGTRQIAEAIGREDARALAVARRAMFWGALLLASAGALIVWLLREIVAEMALGSAEHAGAVGWLALGVALSVASASQAALIQGMRRIGDLARLSIYGALTSTALGIVLLWHWGEAALIAFILVGPLVSFMLGHLYVSRLPRLSADDISIQEMAHQWKTLLRVGIAFMGAGLAGSLVQLWIRVEIGNSLGVDALGHYQAAWMISMQYIGFVLGAMAADFYPRLTGAIHDSGVAAKLVNEQTEIALLLSAPVFIAMMGLAPWVIQLLYSTAFDPAVEVLRWQILGDVLKVASWPLGFVILAAGDGKTFFWTESSSLLLMGALVAGLTPFMGLEIAGISFLVCYCYLAPLVYVLARRRIGIRWTASVVGLLSSTIALCVGTGILVHATSWGVPVSCVIAIGFGVYSLNRLSRMSDLGGPVGSLGAAYRAALDRVRIGRD